MKKILAMFLMAALAAGCGGGEKAEQVEDDGGRLRVAAVNYPLAYFAERIGGDLVEVVFPVPAGEDPAFWNPSAEDVTEFQAADLILLNGAAYAKWVPKVTLSAAKMVNTSASFADSYLAIEDAVTHTHGPGGDHAHTGTAFTTWLDFTQAVAQTEAIGAAFTARRPGDAAAFAAGLADLKKDLLDLDARLTALTAGQTERPLVASHPVYQYLARKYGLDLKAVMWEPEEDPGPAQWRELQDILEDHPAEWMIWEGEPAPASRSRLEGMGVGSLVFSPCMNKPETGDFMKVMRDNLVALEAAFP